MNSKSTSASVPPGATRSDDDNSGRNGENAAVSVGLYPTCKSIALTNPLNRILTYIGVVIVVGAVIVDRLEIVSLL